MKNRKKAVGNSSAFPPICVHVVCIAGLSRNILSFTTELQGL